MEDQQKGICKLSIVPVRAEGKESSELVTQLLFGDHYCVLEISESGDWLRIKIDFDGYIGWINHRQHFPVSETDYEELSNREFPFCGEIAALLQFQEERHHIVFGSRLPFSGVDAFGRSKEVKFEGTSLQPAKNKDFAVLKEFAFQYINSPYLWGGKTPFGIDCSGFVQMVFKLGGYSLQRDASQQAQQGEIVPDLAAAKPGDLAFFQNPAGRVVHVGIVLDNQKIIHASGKVRVDYLDDKGIYTQPNRDYTHRLCLIKRLII